MMDPFPFVAPWILPAAGAATVPGAPAAAESGPLADIADIKPPVSFGLDPDLVRYGLYALAAAVLISAAVLAWRVWRQRREGQIATAVPRLSPEELARLHLANLVAETPPGKVFYFRLSAVLREYLMGRYGIGAVEMTTEELLPHLRRIDLSEGLRTRLRGLLARADAVKFAAVPADASQCREDLAFSSELIDRTSPVTDASEPAALPARRADNGTGR